MISLNLQGRKPIYEQLVEEISRMCLLGVIAPGEQLPSVRTLAGELGINPNTVQKAYRQLEQDGITYTVSGKGCFAADPERLRTAGQEDAKSRLGRAARSCASLGVKHADALEIVNQAYDKGE